MFDLFRSREKSVRYILGAVLGIVALSLVITLIPGYGGGGMGGREDQLLAEIGDDQLTIVEARQVLAREMRANRIPPGTEAVYVPLLIQSMIAERAVAYQAKDMGFNLTQADLAEAIASTIPQLYQDGKFIGREMYAAFLAQQNLTIPQFEENMRKQVASTRLESLVLEGVVVTPTEVEDEFKRQNEKAKVAYFLMTPDKYRAQVTPTDDELKAAYEQRKSGLLIPEKRSYLVFPIEEQTVAATISVDDAAMRQFYQQNLDRYRGQERVHVRHILLNTVDKPKDQVEALRKRMEGLLKQAKSGADFAALATKNSEDPGSAQKGGDLDWVVRGQMVPEFEKATFETKVGQVSDIVTTMYGFHIVKVEAREEARVKPFDEVKDEIKTEVARARVYDRMQTLADQIRAALVKSQAEAEKIAAASGVAPVNVPLTNVGDPIPGVGANPEFMSAVAGLQPGGVTPVVNVGENRLVVAQLKELVPSRQAAMNEVLDTLKSAVVIQKAQTIYEDRLKEASERLKTSSGDIAGVAKAMGFDVKTSDLLTRAGTIEGVGSMVQIEQAFTKNTGETFGPVNVPGGAALLKIVEKAPADMTQLAVQRQAITNALKARRARDRRDLFVDGVVDYLTKKGKLKVYEDNIKKLTASFGSGA